MGFDPRDYVDLEHSRYQTFLKSLDHDTKSIENTVSDALENLVEKKSKSFVIYGEPQSGKTSMMIALTCKLLDLGYKFIIHLVQDNLALERQNRDRFQFSTLNPTPKKLEEILPRDVNLEDREVVVFCKKNSSNLLKLIKRVEHIKNKIIIDDEADYASPNSKVNKVDEKGYLEKTKINERIFNLIGSNGIYIGVTATPARLDLNNTFNNENHRWVFFKPHELYRGQDFFFPITPQDGKFAISYDLVKLSDQAYDPSKELRESIYRFLVNATFLNLFHNKNIKNYIMLIHTSLKMENHADDRKVAEKTFSELSRKKGDKFLKHLERIYKFAYKKTNNEEEAKKITKFIASNADKYSIGVMNSDPENKVDFDLEKFTTNPSTLFTVAIGGNTISRGLTFQNLISMFFTRGVKTIMQQDTYIQRARMFGTRPNVEAENFELTIPENLYKQWFSCFLLHRLSYLSARNNMHQVWLEGSRTRAVAPASIDKANVRIDKGEISFEKIKYSKFPEKNLSKNNKEILFEFNKKFGNEFLPMHVINFIDAVSVNKTDDIAIHNDKAIEDWKEGADHEDISRARGIFGNFDYQKFPLAKHHFKIIFNKKGFARMFYNFRHGKVSFLRNTKDKVNPIDLNQFANIE